MPDNYIPNTEHKPVKPEKLAATAVGALEQKLVLPNLMTKQGIDQYRGADNDTVSVPVEGVLPFHEYGWRNDRSEPIEFDEYVERKVAVSFGGNFYSGVRLTDEQFDMDFSGWGKLLGKQTSAVGRGLEHAAQKEIVDADYNVVIKDIADVLKPALIEARRVLNSFRVPGERVLVCGSDIESLLLANPELGLAQNVGDSEAENLLTDATIGRRYGFTIVRDDSIAPGDAYAFASTAFIFLNAAPSVPQSIKAGGTASFEGISLRWLRDYDPRYLMDRSVVNTYAGFQTVEDILVGWDEAKGSELITSDEYMIRAIKLTSDSGASVYPGATSELGKVTGVSKEGAQLVSARAALTAGD